MRWFANSMKKRVIQLLSHSDAPHLRHCYLKPNKQLQPGRAQAHSARRTLRKGQIQQLCSFNTIRTRRKSRITVGFLHTFGAWPLIIPHLLWHSECNTLWHSECNTKPRVESVLSTQYWCWAVIEQYLYLRLQSDLVPSSSSSSGASSLKKDQPTFTLRQVSYLCERLLKDHEEKIREEYEQILNTKLAGTGGDVISTSATQCMFLSNIRSASASVQWTSCWWLWSRLWSCSLYYRTIRVVCEIHTGSDHEAVRSSTCQLYVFTPLSITSH